MVERTFTTCVACALFALANNPVSAQDPVACRENSWPEDITTPFPYPTGSVISFNSSDARFTSAPSNLVITAKHTMQYVLSNQGSFVVIYPPTPNSIASIAGGFLGSFYRFDRSHLFWAANINTSVSSTVDGKGTPFQVTTVYRNANYSSLEEAISYRDGVVVLLISVRVEGYDVNPDFELFRRELPSIRNAGQSVSASEYNLFKWLNPGTDITNYFAYPGAYINLQRGESRQQFDAATIIVFPIDFCPHISIPQFNSLFCLHNDYGLPYTNTVPTVERGRRPIIIGESIHIETYSNV